MKTPDYNLSTPTPAADPQPTSRRKVLKGGWAAGLIAVTGGAQGQSAGKPAAKSAAMPAAKPDLDVPLSTGSTKITASKGRAMTVYFEGKRCIHARFCVLGSPAVFLANVEGEWIRPDAESAEDLTHTIRQCPSGALSYKRHDGGAQEPMAPVNLITMRENGPLAVHAELNLKGAGKMQRATLCRCGASQNKPFCDNSHKATNFSASGQAPVGSETKALAKRNGPLTVVPTTDGPYAVSGNMEICTGTGTTIARMTGTILCRCGGSKNKPFCDGTHATINFKAPGAETA